MSEHKSNCRGASPPVHPTHWSFSAQVEVEEATGELVLLEAPTSVFGVVVHDYSPGIAKWLRDAAVSFQAGDLLVGIGDDDVRGWPMERVLARLCDRRVASTSDRPPTVAFLVERRPLLDA